MIFCNMPRDGEADVVVALSLGAERKGRQQHRRRNRAGFERREASRGRADDDCIVIAPMHAVGFEHAVVIEPRNVRSPADSDGLALSSFSEWMSFCASIA